MKKPYQIEALRAVKRCRGNTVSKLCVLQLLELALSEKQIPQLIELIEKR